MNLRVTDSPLLFTIKGQAGEVWVDFTIRYAIARLSVSFVSLEEAEEDQGIVRVWRPTPTPATLQEGIEIMRDLASHLSEEIRRQINEHL